MTHQLTQSLSRNGLYSCRRSETNQTAVLLTRRVFRRSPFAPRALPRFITTTGFSDSRALPPARLLIPSKACRLSRHRGGPPKFLTVLSARAVSFYPGELCRCFQSLLPGKYWLHHLRQAGHSQFCVTRLNRVRLRYSSRVRLPRLRRRNYSRAPLGRLHVQRSIHMTDSFHSVRNSQALLGAPEARKGKGWRVACHAPVLSRNECCANLAQGDHAILA